MFYGVSHVDVSVTDLPRARRFYADAFGFVVKREGPGFCDVDTNTVVLRLIETRSVEHRSALRLQVSDVEKAFARLVELGARALYEPLRTPQLELVGSVADWDGNALSVWRNLSEDEYGFLPELPTAQSWQGEASQLLQSLLVGVPSLFRGLARRKVVREAEDLAEGRDVGREDVIRAYIRASAKITRGRVKKPLLAHGIDPDHYRADFEW
jgi:predicted enzyme related to lactoylglutathione lyase